MIKLLTMNDLTVAKAIIFDGENNILTLRRSETHPRFAYHLDFPGGIVEQNEKPVNAMKREILEETGLDIDQNSLRLLLEKNFPERNVSHLIFKTKLDVCKPNISISWEHDKYEWMKLQDILDQDVPDTADNYHKTMLSYLNSI